MRAGRLRHSVTIENYSESRDAYGEPDKSWATYATTWAAIEPLRGDELMVAQQRDPAIKVRIVCRYVAGVTAAMRVKFGSRYFAIKSVMNRDERDRELELECEEGRQDGS